MTTEIAGVYAVAEHDKPSRCQQVRADGPLEAAREYFGEYVTIGAKAGAHWSVLNRLPAMYPQHPDGQTMKIGTVYLIAED